MDFKPSFYRYHGDGAYHGPPPQPGDWAPLRRRDEHGDYLAPPELVLAVNTALAVRRPLLVTGEPGTGKTSLAWSIATELGLATPLTFFTRSDSQAREALYSFDHLRRFYHAQMKSEEADDPLNYYRDGALGEAIRDEGQRVVLFDEIDKAPRDFPNDLLNELDKLEFRVPELGGRRFARGEGQEAPFILITSNSERDLPDAFLRRCVFHHIAFPDAEALEKILAERLAHLDLAEGLVSRSAEKLLAIREEVKSLDKRPATGELITWVEALHAGGISAEAIQASALRDLPLPGVLLKTHDDLGRLRRHG